MADYNIYIHSVGGQNTGNGGANFTMPWRTTNDGDSDSGISQNEDYRELTPEFIAQETGQGAMKGGMVGAIIAAGVAVVKISIKIGRTINEFRTMQTGDFRSTIAYQNLDATINAIKNPIPTMINYLKDTTRIEIQNQTKEKQRELLGDSEINRYINRGC